MKEDAAKCASLWLALRKLYEQNPDDFAAFVSQILKAGDNWLDLIPPPDLVRGKPRHADGFTLPILLARYLSRPAGMTREVFVNQIIESGGHLHCSLGRYFVGVWRRPDVINKYIKRAQKCARADPAFAYVVRVLREKGYPDLVGVL